MSLSMYMSTKNFHHAEQTLALRLSCKKRVGGGGGGGGLSESIKRKTHDENFFSGSYC